MNFDEDRERLSRLDDVRIREVRPLISPALLQEELPTDTALQAFIERSRQQVADVVHGRDPRLLMVVGPCSIHDADQALEYAARLHKLAGELSDALLVVMRVYFEKPRTTVGWKGWINDPHLDGSFRINEGLRRARELLLAVARMGLPAATEFLDLLSPQYIADLVSWGAIGARTTESPSHRQLASGLSCAIGFKNGTDGGVQIAADGGQRAACLHGHDQDGHRGGVRDRRQCRLPHHPAWRLARAQLQCRRHRGRVRDPGEIRRDAARDGGLLACQFVEEVRTADRSGA
jgi:3-deoxy-7-phosphoheptulonate synthase